MPTEMVLLCDTEPTPAQVGQAGLSVCGGGVLLGPADRRVMQWVDDQGRAVLSVFAARQVEVRDDADRAVVGGTGGYRWWVDMTVPYGDAREGVALARALAQAVGGRVAART